MDEFKLGLENSIVQKGLLDVLLELQEGGKTFSELKNAIRISPNTVLKRLRELERNGCVLQILFQDEGKRRKIRYVLTEEGMGALSQYASVVERYSRLREKLDRLRGVTRTTEKEIKYLLLYGSNPDARNESK